MKKKFALLVFIYLGFIGCSYDFSSDYYLDIERKSAEETTISLNDFTNLDTINVQRQMKYTFNGAPNQYTIDAEVYLDNEKIGLSFNGNIGTFTLMPSRYDDGTHNIRVEHSFTSGSGSLADQAQLEILNKTANFQFVVKRNPSTPPAITAVNIKDGSIQINWAALDNSDYKDAYLSLKFNRFETKIPLTAEMLASGSYIDKSTVLFIGNYNTPDYDDYAKVTYSILFTNEYTETYSSNKTLTYDPSWFNMKIAYHNAESYKIKWSSHPLYANFEFFEFGAGVGTFLGSSNGGEHLVNEPYVFGKKYSGHAQIIQNNDYQKSYNFYEIDLDEDTFGLFDFNKFFSKNILYNPSTKQYYALVIEGRTATGYVAFIYQYSQNMEFIKKEYIAETELPRHDFLKFYLDPISYNFYLDTDYSSYIIDKTSLKVLAKYSDQTSLTSRVAIRGNILKIWNFNTKRLTLTNTNTNTIIYSGESLNQGVLSKNGKYVYMITSSANTIYKIVNNQLEKVIDIGPLSPAVLDFENDTLFYKVEGAVFIVNLNTLAVKNFSFGNYQASIQFDPISQKLLIANNGYNCIYDVKTEQITIFNSATYKSITGYFNSEDRSYYLSLQNGRLIHSKGIYLDNF